jgi:HSP20 family molecular chaperone IbpA
VGWDVNPFRAMQRMADEMDRLFEGFDFGRRWLRPSWRETGAESWAPEVEVFQKNHELTIRADLPGLKREDVTVDINDNDSSPSRVSANTRRKRNAKATIGANAAMAASVA